MHGSLIASASVALAQFEVPLEPVIAAFATLRHVGGTTILNPAPARPLPRELLMVTDIVVPNEHEAEILGGVEAIRAAGATTVVVTEGERGARVITPDGEHRVEAFEVAPIDTTAAGDAFCGALAARLAAGDRLLDALRWAAAAGALATTKQGAVPSLPRRAAIETLAQRRRVTAAQPSRSHRVDHRQRFERGEHVFVVVGEHPTDHEHARRSDHPQQVVGELDQRRGEDVGDHHVVGAVDRGQWLVRHRHLAGHPVARRVGLGDRHGRRRDVDAIGAPGAEQAGDDGDDAAAAADVEHGRARPQRAGASP